jgi:pimeloyl-ACP methyl ester carboxylesterase
LIRNLTVDGRRIALRVNDSGWEEGRKTLFFIHGSGCDHHLWDGQYGPLGKEFNVAGIDLPGHGASDGPGEESVDAYVAWVRKTLRAAGLKRPVLVGHSLGAAVSLTFALRHGDELLGIAPVGGGATMPVNPQILEGITADRQATIGFIAKFSFARENRSKFGGEMAEALMKVDPALVRGDFLACSRLDLTAQLEGIAVPALLVCGEEDKMTPPEFSRFMAGKIPGAKLLLVPGAGHFVMWETAGALNDALGDFTRRLPAG